MCGVEQSVVMRGVGPATMPRTCHPSGETVTLSAVLADFRSGVVEGGVTEGAT
jgi:hypothetical protein